ncbi:uncharacterized protein [Haliotis cracherodii]|uniref:uncharacterized protein n=1 Tax=Haliotis cracherodii TaxID=6455 RepID=UPI0039E7C5C2
MHTGRAFVVCVYFVLAAHGDTRTGNRWIEKLSGVFTVQLQCSAGERIHVEQEAYGDGDAATCSLKSESCSKVHNSSQNGLIVNCNGKQSCREAMSTSNLTCNVTDAAAEVKYNCIKVSMDMCNSVNTTVNGSVYLHSPGFPDSVPVNSNCIVRITGQNIQVTLLEKRMKTGLLNISGDGEQLWTSVNVDQYNRVLPKIAAEVVIFYDNHDQNGSDVWIRVAASGQMKITFNELISDASTTPVPMPTHQPSRSQDTTSQRTSVTTATTTSAPPTTMDKSTSEATTENMTSTPPFVTDNMALSTTTSTTASYGSDPGTVVASAASGCVILILIVVIAVVLCRRHRVKNSGSPDAPGSGSFERSFELTPMNIEKHPNGLGQNETSNMFFVLDPELVAGSGERILHTESRHETENYKNPVLDQYSNVLPRSSRVNMYDNSTFTVPTSTADNGVPQLLKDSVASTAYNDHRAICDMTENDIYDGEVASKDVTVDGMVDNGHHCKFEYDREDGYVQGESDASPSNTKPIRKEKADMIENDVYDGGPPLSNDPVGYMDDNDNPDKRSMSTEKSHMTEHDLYDGLDTGDDTGGGMVDNELYDKCRHDRERDSIQDESDASPSNVFDKSVQDDEDSVMVSNGLYHSFK